MGKAPSTLPNGMDHLPLTEALRKVLRLAQRIGDTEFTDWCRREIGGYFSRNPAMTNDIIVPEYRTVVGQHADMYGRVLQVPPDFSFINETRLRQGTEELDMLASRDLIKIHDPGMCELIQEHFHVEVYTFSFSSVHLRGVLSSIRTELEQKFLALDVESNILESATEVSQDDIILLQPNIYGIGVDLRALWRRLQNRS